MGHAAQSYRKLLAAQSSLTRTIPPASPVAPAAPVRRYSPASFRAAAAAPRTVCPATHEASLRFKQASASPAQVRVLRYGWEPQLFQNANSVSSAAAAFSLRRDTAPRSPVPSSSSAAGPRRHAAGVQSGWFRRPVFPARFSTSSLLRFVSRHPCPVILRCERSEPRAHCTARASSLRGPFTATSG